MAQQATLEAPRQGDARQSVDFWCGRAILAIVIFVCLSWHARWPLARRVRWNSSSFNPSPPWRWRCGECGCGPNGLSASCGRRWPGPFSFFFFTPWRACPVVPVEYVGNRQQFDPRRQFTPAWFVLILNNLNRRGIGPAW